MAKRNFHIVFSLFLLVNTLFVQVGADFFHSEGCGKSGKEHPVKGFQLKRGGEECSICGLDLFHEFYFTESRSLVFTPPVPEAYYTFFTCCCFDLTVPVSGRAPPVC